MILAIDPGQTGAICAMATVKVIALLLAILVVGRPDATIKTRIARYGWDHPDVLAGNHLQCGGNYGCMPIGKPKRNPETIRIGSWEAANL